MPKDLLFSHMNNKNLMLIKNLANQIIKLIDSEPEYGHNLYFKNMCSMLMILIIRSCMESDIVVKKHRTKKLIMDDIFHFLESS